MEWRRYLCSCEKRGLKRNRLVGIWAPTSAIPASAALWPIGLAGHWGSLYTRERWGCVTSSTYSSSRQETSNPTLTVYIIALLPCVEKGGEEKESRGGGLRKETNALDPLLSPFRFTNTLVPNFFSSSIFRLLSFIKQCAMWFQFEFFEDGSLEPGYFTN